MLPLSRCKLLFICARNKIRSLTAERMLHGSTVHDVRSRGVARGARVRLTAGDLGWADRIFVMEKQHKDRIRAEFADALGDKPIDCLFIPDDYQLMEPRLLAVLRERLLPHIELPDP